MILVGLLRHYVVQLLGGKPKKQDVKGIREQRALMRSAVLRQNGRVLSSTAFMKRKQYLIESFKDGKYLKNQPKEDDDKEHTPPNPFSDPDQMENMMDGMKKQMVMFIPQTVIMGWINSFFSGFILIKLPFPLTRGFKTMLQRGIMTPDMPASYVSSISWYFLNLFGLNSVLRLILGDGNGGEYSQGNKEFADVSLDADGVRDLQTVAQLAGANTQANPMQNQDMSKVFKAEIDNLELSEPKSLVDDVSKRVLEKYAAK